MLDRTSTLTLLEQQAGKHARIQLLQGGARGQLIDLTRQTLSIGRTDENDIVLDSNGVSRTHAFLTFHDGQWIIRDNGSKNGVQVNGVRTLEQPLRHGNIVQVGDCMFRFIAPEATVRQLMQARRTTAEVLHQTRRPGPGPAAWVLGAAVGIALYGFLSDRNVSVTERVKPTTKAATKSIEISRPTPEELEAIRQEFAKTQASLDEAIAPPVEGTATTQSDKEAKPVVTDLKREDIAIRTGWPRNKKSDDEKALATYLREGREYLADGDFDAAAAAFNFALVIDRNNAIALEGMERAGRGIRTLDIDDIKQAKPAPGSTRDVASKGPASKQEREKLVDELFKVAESAFQGKQYQLAINKAEEIREIEIPGETVYLNEAKQIIDRARMKQKEEFEPFIEQARILYTKRAFRASRDLCNEMLKRDAYYTPAKDCVEKAESALSRQASVQ